MKTLGGATMIYNAISQDYCFIETLNCLHDICDQVAISCGGDDGTVGHVMIWASDKPNVIVTVFSTQDWVEQVGHTKLSYFSNIAIGILETDWVLYVQCDEVVHERSENNIRRAMELGKNGYVFNRYNMWQDPFHMLNLSQERKPCSTEVIRLAKRGAFCYSDAEHLAVDGVEVFETLDSIEIYHLGYIRDPKKHLVKIKHMLVDVFRVEMDKRAENCEEFTPERWFKAEDLTLVPLPLPKYCMQWCAERYPALTHKIMER